MTSPRRLHPAWIVLVAVTACMAGGAGLRAIFGVFIRPLEADFGWTRSALSGVAGVSLLLIGAVGPFAGRLADRFGPRVVVLGSVVLMGAGALGASAIGALWHVYLTVGVVLAVGAGGLGISTGSAITMRWFEGRRGLAMGIAAGGMSAGQLIVIPLATGLMVWLGWRGSFFWLGIGSFALVLPVAAWLIRDQPSDRGVAPYGATGVTDGSARVGAGARARRVGLLEAARFPQLWLLMATFFVCGYTSNGMVLTHFMPHALDHNFTELQASTALGIMGAMNIAGTVGSGWICDRFGSRGPLATYYFLRGVSLLFLLYVWDTPSLHLWAVIFGLNYISTVPPTTTLTATIFGRDSVGELSGWIYFAHQVGAALGAAVAGWVFEVHGSYGPAFVSAAVLGVVAAGLTLLIRDVPAVSPPPLASAPASAS